MKKISLLMISLILILILAACGSTPAKPTSTTAAAAEKTFTLEELKKYNGKDGNRAYVAVDGIVYDMSDSKFWKSGQHNGFEAGKDLTNEIKNDSPHGVKNLERVPVVGKLVP